MVSRDKTLASCFECDDQDQRMYRDTLDGLADVEAGRIIDGGQVMAWVESRGYDNELSPPRT